MHRNNRHLHQRRGAWKVEWLLTLEQKSSTLKGTSLEALGKENGLLRHVGVGPSLSAINSKIWDEIVDSSEWQ
jgi:hypothetical protein